ncbi:MAG: CoA-binding protein [Bacteroidetes bacterium]|nr:CoA-binding protein [Bacteroidota bacterium]
MKKTLVLGANPNPESYAYKAVQRLRERGHLPIPVGIREGYIGDLPILTQLPHPSDVDTITLYIAPKHQKAYYDYLLELKPKRIIFNPGTENPELETLAAEHQIETLEACTLVMLSIGVF